jgi:hypothetical protein
MMNDPEHIAMLLKIKEEADKIPKRGRPITKQQPKTHEETFDWMAPQLIHLEAHHKSQKYTQKRKILFQMIMKMKILQVKVLFHSSGTLIGKTAAKTLDV